MSWITDLAGKAETILNKIDQNAATVLQQMPRPEATEKHSIDETLKVSIPKVTTTAGASSELISDGLKRNSSSTPLSLSRTQTPKKVLKNDLSSKQSSSEENTSIRPSEKQNNSNVSSRRSSLSSRADGTATTTVSEFENGHTDLRNESSKSNEMANSITLVNSSVSVEKELAAIRIVLAEVSSERNDLKEELLQLQEEIKQSKNEYRIKELEITVNSLVNERDKISRELNELQKSNMEYVRTISELETNFSKSRQNILELQEKLEWQSKEAEERMLELQQYRKKAQTTLQSKDKLIEELKSKISNNSFPSATMSLSGKNSVEAESDDNMEINQEKIILRKELDSLRKENQHLNEDLQLLFNQVEKYKTLIQQLEEKCTDINMEKCQMQESSMRNLRSEQQRALELESEVKILNQELIAVRDETNRQRQSFSARLHEKESEIQKLRYKASELPNLGNTNSLENRIVSLTQALVNKQATIENITAEKNALRIQLEKVEDQLRHVIAQNRQQQELRVINVNDTDDAKSQLPRLLRENPFDTNMTRKVKRAYSSLDSAGIRIGVFLRRYPLMRIMVFLYVALLHIWVMFVLLSSTPA